MSAIGSLIYAMLCTRLDICFVVGLVSHYQRNLGPVQWRATKKIFRYLKGLEILSSAIKLGTWRLRRYCNADWTSDRDEHKSTIRYAFLLNDTTIT